MGDEKPKANAKAHQEPSLLLKVEQIKYRKAGPGKSPLGTFCIYEDRIEWTSDVDASDQLLVHLSKIKGQRISPPNKPKVQLQLCMLNDDQATFVFMNSAHDQQKLLEERDLVKEAIQQALVRHRQFVNQMAQKAAKGATDKEQKAKIQILEQNAHLYQLYLHLVKEKLITAQDFWSIHYKNEEKSANVDISGQKVGISGGFLSSIVQSEGIGGGIRLNLTGDTIQSIFRTYPAVERKHLELVPHEMTEQEFWSRFFQSHYFHRERNPAEPSTSHQANDPFADCVRMDEKDMRQIVEKGQQSLKRHLDLTSINEDFGILSEMRSSQISLRGSTEAKRLLVRRCNYHSERVLVTMEEDEEQQQQVKKKREDGNNAAIVENGFRAASTPKSDTGSIDNASKTSGQVAVATFDLQLESEELAELDRPSDEYYSLVAYNPPQLAHQKRTEEQIESARSKLEEAFGVGGSVFEQMSQVAFFDSLTTTFLDDQLSLSNQMDATLVANINFQGLNRADVERIRVVHSCLAELLRHFWHCFPPRTPEMEQKIFRMDETLAKFEQKQLAECEERYGTVYVQHCKQQLALARQRFKAFSAASRAAQQQQKR